MSVCPIHITYANNNRNHVNNSRTQQTPKEITRDTRKQARTHTNTRTTSHTDLQTQELTSFS